MKNETPVAITHPRYYGEAVEIIEESPKTRHFFAAANSAGGFVSFFDEIFGGKDIERLYILGGGPGSGKSTMMKRVAALSQKNGYTTEHIHCSSSPYSLDGVIIAEKRIAVIDGTAPHTYAPKVAGVREITVDPGRAWDRKALWQRKDKIYALGEAKKNEYRKAYIYIRAAGLLDKQARDMVKPYILNDKLEKAMISLADKEIRQSENGFSRSVRLQRAVSGAGNIYFESLSKTADKTYLVDDSRGIAAKCFDVLMREAKSRSAAVTVSYDPENTEIIDGLYFPETGTAFTLYASQYDKKINCERFADKNAIVNIRQKCSFAAKSRASLLAEGYEALKKAGKYHNEIEAEYYPCTDYSVTEGITAELCGEIF